MAIAKETVPYTIQPFNHSPGLYFDKIGHLHQVKDTWRTVIKLDMKIITQRGEQIQTYIDQTDRLCQDHSKSKEIKTMCKNLIDLANKELQRIYKTTHIMNSVYRTKPNPRRGLIDGLGTLAKTLFGTMDANDEKIINEQLHLIQNNQITFTHAITNQIQILNKTIGHMNSLEETLNYNTQLLWNSASQLEEAKWETLERENIDEHFTLINAVLTDIIRDQNDVFIYLNSISKGTLPPQIAPIKEIITQLEEVTTHLPHDIHFPFTLSVENWLQISKFIDISAYYTDENIFTILKIPLVTYAVYELVNIIPLPTPNGNNLFTLTEITHTTVAINRDSHTYIIVDKVQLNECIKINNHFTCKHTHPIYHMDTETPCEIQTYISAGTHPSCPTKHITITHTLITALERANAWLYAAVENQIIRIQCTDEEEVEEKLRGTGLIQASQQCKFTIDHITLQTQGLMEDRPITMYVPKFNLTFPKDNETLETQTKEMTKIKPKQIIQNPTELINLQKQLSKVHPNVDNYQSSSNISPHIIYTTIPGGIVIVVVLIITLAIYLYKRANRKTTPTTTIPQVRIEIPEIPKIPRIKTLIHNRNNGIE